MANIRATANLNHSGGSDENSNHGTKSSTHIQLPNANTIANAHSSSSSIDSAGARNNKPVEIMPLTNQQTISTISSTTTDSEYESEQENDENRLSKSLDLPNDQQTVVPSTNQSNRNLINKDKPISNPEEQLSRRVKHFRKLFKSAIIGKMPELIDSFVCAYQGDILLQGKMYITDQYLCFHSRIISYVTKHVHAWGNIEQVTKERVAFIFPTAIGIKLRSSERKIIYASFLQRDLAYEKILQRISHNHSDSNSLPNHDDENELRSTGSTSIKSNHLSNSSKKPNIDVQMESLDPLHQEDVQELCFPEMNDDPTTKSKRRHQSSSTRKGIKDKPTVPMVNPVTTLPFRNVTSFDEPNSERKHLRHRSTPTPKDTSRQSNPGTPTTDHSTLQQSSLLTSHGQNASSSNVNPTGMYPINSSSNISESNSYSISNPNPIQWVINASRFLLLFLFSLLEFVINYFLLLLDRFKIYPMKMSIILLIFVSILIIHSFYLIKLAYRIEYRLQSLHHMWPSPSSKPFE